MELGSIHHEQHQANVIRWRLLLSAVVITCLAVVLVGRGAHLQVLGHERYTEMAHDNRVRLLPIPPTRGLIYDRNGELLAENIPAHQLVITPEQVSDLEATLDKLGDIVELRPTDLENFRNQRQRMRSFQAIPLKHQLSDEEVARFAINRHRFPGVELEAELVRHYPNDALAAHAIGYVGRISKAELGSVDPEQYQGSSNIGKSGIEGYYEKRLHGDVGVERVETNAAGRVLRTLEREPPKPGEDLQLSLDMDLQRTAKDSLGERAGSVIAMVPDTGEILAMVSKPSFDPNLFATGIGLEAYQALQQQANRPLFHRSINGQYPPASTIKPFVALAGLTTETREPDDTIECTGRYTLPNVDHVWQGWKRWGHGEMNLKQAVAQSCDIYFYDLAYDLGIQGIHDKLGPFGFGRKTGIDLSGEDTGILPSKTWKKRNKGEPWYHGETLITGIGQGFTLSTPLQLARATAIMANQGEPITPHLFQKPASSETGNGDDKQNPMLDSVSDEDWQHIHASMVEVMHGDKGTARSSGRNAAYRIAGKTGTSQVFGLGPDQEYNEEELPRHLHDHGLFVAFAPADDPQIAVAVVVEHGGSGSTAAAPVARDVLDAWLVEEQ